MLRMLFVSAILVPGVVAALFNRFAALLVYLWFALFRPQEWLWVDITAYRPSLLLGILLVVPCVLSGILPNVTHPLSVGTMLFLASGLVAQHNAVNPETGWLWLDFMARLVLVNLLMVTLITTKRRLVQSVAVVGLCIAFYSAKAGVTFLIQGGTQFDFGFGGAYPDNEGYSLAIVMILPFLVATAQNVESRWIRWGCLAAVPLSILTVIGTFSRGGFLGLVAAVGTFLLVQRRRLVGVTLIGLACAVFVVVAPIPTEYVERLKTIKTYEEIGETSALSRFHFWAVAMDMVGDYPLGIGLNNYEYLYDAYDTTDGLYGRSRAVHNSTLEVLAETGFIGLAAWVFLFVSASRRCWRMRALGIDERLSLEDRRFFETYANAFMASMAGFTVAGSFLAIALNDITWLTFGFVAALERLSSRAARGMREPNGDGVKLSRPAVVAIAG